MADRNLDEYKHVKFYADNTTVKQSGFSKFEFGKDFYFCRYIDGEIAMLSQAYTSIAGRDNGIESVKKNEKIAKRFVFEARDGNRHGFALKAGNGQEIAISPDYASRGQAERVSGRMSGTTTRSAAPRTAVAKPKTRKSAAPRPAKTKAFTSSDGRVGNYKPLSFYQTYGGRANGFNSFERDGAYYFHYNRDGNIVLISESYTSASGRDNGIASVTKNLKRPAAYQHRQHKNGQYYFDLNAGNHQEIATSRWYSSRPQAMQSASGLRGGQSSSRAAASKPRVASKPRAVSKPRAASGEQNYMPVAFYTKATKGKAKGFESFKGNDGEYYFTYFENNKVALISEGYPTAAIRDKGLASVQKNIKIEKRYVFGKGADGKEGFILRAGNNKEIARSVGYGSAAGAVAGAAYLMGTRRRVTRKTVKPAAATSSAGRVAAAKPKTTRPKVVKTRVSKPKAAKPKVAAPKAAKTQVAKPKASKSRSAPKKSVKPAAAALAAGSLSPAKKEIVKKPKAVKKPEKAKTKAAKKTTRSSVAPLAAGGAAIAGLGASAAAAKSNAAKKAAVPVKPPTVKPTPVKPAPVKPVTVKLVPPKAPEVKPAPVKKPIPPVAAPIAAAGTAAIAGAAALGAKSLGATPKAKPVAAAPVAAKPAVAPVAVAAKPVAAAPIAAAASVSAAPAAAVAASGGGGVWGWLKWIVFALLALFAMFFLFKACAGGGTKEVKITPPAKTTETAVVAPLVSCWNGSKAKDEQSCPTKITCWDNSFATRQSACPAQPAPTPAPTAPPTPAGTTVANAAPNVSVANTISAPSIDGRICAPSSNVLFNVTGSRPKSVTVLGTNPQFGNSLSLTPERFYRKLVTAAQTNQSDRAFLNLMARDLGYGSFANMNASMFSNDVLPNGTSGLLGFGSQHALQYSTLNMTDPTHLEAFKVRSANGTDVHIMKRCGNYMYVCQP